MEVKQHTSNNTWLKEGHQREKLKKYSDPNEMKHNCQNLLGAAKPMLEGTFIVLNAYIRIGQNSNVLKN